MTLLLTAVWRPIGQAARVSGLSAPRLVGTFHGMAWTVRNQDGALDFPTLADVERAWRMGLVGPDDELRADGQTRWQKASEHPALRSSPRAGHPKRTGLPSLNLALVVAFAIAALVLLAIGQWTFGLVLALGLSMYLMRMNRRLQKPRTFARV